MKKSESDLEDTDHENVTKFLLAEYETLRSFRQDLISLGENRLNFFLATVSAVGLGLTFINQLQEYRDKLFFLNGIILTGLFFVGIMTFIRMVERSIAITIYTRGLNRIRNWFVKKNPGLEEYIILPIHDDKPSFMSRAFVKKGFTSSGLPEMIALVNSILAAILISILFVLSQDLETAEVVLIGIITVLVMFIGQQSYHVTHLREAAKSTSVIFPTNPNKKD